MSIFQHNQINLGDEQPLTYGTCGEAGLGTIVLVTNWPQPEYLFHDLALLLSDAGWKVIVPALRSHLMVNELGYDDWLTLHSRDIERVCDHETEQPVAVVGHGGGAHVGLTLLQRCPEMLESMVVMACPIMGTVSFQPRGARSWLFRLFRQLDMHGMASRYWTKEKSARKILQRLSSFEKTHLWADHGVVDVDFATTIATSPVPVLILEGRDDPLNIVARTESAIACTTLRWVENRIIDDAGHFLMLDAIDEVGLAIDAFIAPTADVG